MRRVLLDTNIILDFALQRADFGEDDKKFDSFSGKK